MDKLMKSIEDAIDSWQYGAKITSSLVHTIDFLIRQHIPEAALIRKDERERIINLLPNIPTRFNHNKTCFDCVERIKLQALQQFKELNLDMEVKE